MSNDVVKYNMEDDIMSSSIICQKCSANRWYAQNLYAAMCNNIWQKIDVTAILRDDSWGISWRGSGRVVAEAINSHRQDSKHNYMDFYCSGMASGFMEDVTESGEQNVMYVGYLPEGTVSEVIRQDLRDIGWHCIDENGKKM